MKKITLLAILAIAAFSNNANAQESATATASATIVTPLSIEKKTDLNFGNIGRVTSGGAVVMGTDNLRTASGSDITLQTGSAPVAAKFTVTGEGSFTYALSLPASITLSNTDASSTMIVDAFTSNSTKTLTAGKETFNVGATLKLTASQPAGTYTNTTDLIVTVNYN